MFEKILEKVNDVSPITQLKLGMYLPLVDIKIILKNQCHPVIRHGSPVSLNADYQAAILWARRTVEPRMYTIMTTLSM